MKQKGKKKKDIKVEVEDKISSREKGQQSKNLKGRRPKKQRS